MEFSIQTYNKIRKKVKDILMKKPFNLSGKNDIEYLAFTYCKLILDTSDLREFTQVKAFLRKISKDSITEGLTSLYFRLSNNLHWQSWKGTIDLKNVPIHITNVEKTLSYKIAYTLDAIILNSTISNPKTKLIISGEYCQYLLHVGGSIRSVEYTPTDLAGLYFLTTVKPKTDLYLKLINFSTSTNMFNSNRKLLKERRGECIGGFKEGTCMDCPVSSKDCRLSRHIKKYKKGPCRVGGHTGYIVKDNICKYCLDNHKYIKQLKIG